MLKSKSHKKRLKAIELFAGAGGMALGIQQSGVDVVGIVEIDKWCLDTLKANQRHAFPKAQIIEADISKISGGWLLKQVGLKKGQLDVLSGGPPCQGFSFANNANRSIEDPRSKLMWQYIRIVEEIRPRYFIIENVRGLLSFNDFFYTLIETLEGKGYAVRFNLLDACSYGVPQHRERVFIEGARKDLKILPRFPAPTHFSPEMIKSKTIPPLPSMAEKCFATNGFAKEEIKDCWLNRTLHIFMNRKTAAARVEQATRELFLEALLKHSKLATSKKPVRLVRVRMIA